MTNQTPPRWDLTNVYPSLASAEFAADFEALKAAVAELGNFLSGAEALDASSGASLLAEQVGGLIERYNAIRRSAHTLFAYVQSFVTTDSFNKEALRKLSELEIAGVELEKLETRLVAWIGRLAPALPEITRLPGAAHEHAFFLQEVAEQSRYLMSQPEEDIATELNLSGANAWSKLQSTVVSQYTMDLELDGKVQKLPMPAIINLRGHPDESVRRRAYEAELQAWAALKEPVAAAMNGIKGTVNTLNKRRGRTDCLHSALDINRIDRATLDAMLFAMRESLPMFRRYFHAKARRLGKERLAWWDLFAPAGSADRTYTWEQARAFVLENFAHFSPDLAAFAERAFAHNWIDAEQRAGKTAGAFCMSVPSVEESRILLSFDGSLDVVSTLAHELGHGYHNHCMYAAGRTELQHRTPMTMAETASIMCETIVSSAVLENAASDDERLAILEAALINDSQVVVDIYSRFLFEKEVFERRESAELSAEELCEIMTRAQKEAYGDGLDERYLQPYMWVWKPHYYDAGLSFYNFPYTFGLLFGTGLYAIYQQRGQEFIPQYRALLASTGMGRAADLADGFGINIRQPEFWQDSLGIVEQRLEKYIALIG
ncbi:MAG TPA: M3 family oligoendopeptidase [Anaerolineaceae bacterium]|nr:M3 family oligoendopeptidase [Anaerolineaceae bacterium]HQF46590.1 M3 family oligoendopeptidase [Anaerolineaceae bacterium]